jgi:hypothetical protein
MSTPDKNRNAISRRLFIKGGLVAAAVTACGGGTRLVGTTTGPSLNPSAADDTRTIPSTTEPGGIDVMGEYSILDETYGASVSVTLDGTYRYITANGLPDHATGEFPNAHNPNSISAQSYSYRLPLMPTVREATPYNVPQSFGIAVNGVPFDPFAAEWYQNDRTSGWQVEASSGFIDLGLDANNAHVQPNGAYHYHAIPTGLVPDLSADSHSPLVGWAGDGFPIYVRYGYREATDPTSGIIDMQSSYRLRSGTRQSGPGGDYDGTYVEDYEYTADAGDLDESNGRFGVTPEYPDGTYYYVLTEAFPAIPRYFKAATDPTFEKVGR